ncbi:hypothetical protein SK128_016640 [Halocaridina rubra]|uniref:Uncharacterized protein n=1 Tax=Halocaridina rubra TaxID=373956 RepID=A0AAN9ABD4_HALRR
MSSRDDKEFWGKHVPIPRTLEIIVQVMKKYDADLWAERIFPTLCFSLPPNGQECAEILKSLPSSSTVWEKLEKGLANNSLPLEVFAALCQQRPSVLEKELFHIFSMYGKTHCFDKEYDIKVFTVARFKKRGVPFSKLITKKISADCHLDQVENLWLKSKIPDAAAYSKAMFDSCIKIFLRLGLDSQFSFSFVHGTSDFFSCLFYKLSVDLFKYFPSHVQHIVYLLTMPLSLPIDDFQANENAHEVELVEETLLKLLGDFNIHYAESLLCFFTFWLPVLSERRFLQNYLNFQIFL